MALRELVRNRSHRFKLKQGDTFHLSYTDAQGVKKNVLSKKITEDIDVDTIVVFEVKDELGLEVAIAGAFGKSKE